MAICLERLSLENGNVTYNQEVPLEEGGFIGYSKNTRLDYSCNSGFHLTGPTSATCTERIEPDGFATFEWAPSSTPKCSRKSRLMSVFMSVHTIVPSQLNAPYLLSIEGRKL